MMNAQELATEIAKAQLYAADNEAEAISENFPSHLKAEIPARGEVSGAERLAIAHRLAPSAKRIQDAEATRESKRAEREERAAMQAARHILRDETAAHYQNWLNSKDKSGEYVALHDAIELSPKELAQWKPSPEAIEAVASGNTSRYSAKPSAAIEVPETPERPDEYRI